MENTDKKYEPIIAEQCCPCCGAYEPEYYYLDDDEECIGCSECIYKTDVIF